jgi:hypothetical protein
MNTKRAISPQELLESLSVFQLSYMLSKILNHWYDFGGFSAGRSHRSVLLDLFMSVNCKLNVIKFDVFEHAETATKRAQELIDSHIEHPFQGKINIRNRKVLSCVLLHLLMQHYVEEMVKNENLQTEKNPNWNAIDFSFKRHFPMFKLLHDVYMLGVGLSEDQLSQFVQMNPLESLRHLIEWYPKRLRG